MEDAFDADEALVCTARTTQRDYLKQSRIAVVNDDKEMIMRMVLLWLLGVPISLLILLKLFGVL